MPRLNRFEVNVEENLTGRTPNQGGESPSPRRFLESFLVLNSFAWVATAEPSVDTGLTSLIALLVYGVIAATMIWVIRMMHHKGILPLWKLVLIWSAVGVALAFLATAGLAIFSIVLHGRTM